MATKSITITNEAYEGLSAFKEPTDSFSDVVNRLTKRDSLLNLVGILSPKEADEMNKSVKEMRNRLRKQMNASRLK